MLCSLEHLSTPLPLRFLLGNLKHPAFCWHRKPFSFCTVPAAPPHVLRAPRAPMQPGRHHPASRSRNAFLRASVSSEIRLVFHAHPVKTDPPAPSRRALQGKVAERGEHGEQR